MKEERDELLTFDEVVMAVRRSSLDLPGGSIKARGGEILLRTDGQAYRGREFEDLVLLNRGDGTRLGRARGYLTPQELVGFLDRAADELGEEPKILRPETMEYMSALAWPGNVRQLENTCRWLTVMASGPSSAAIQAASSRCSRSLSHFSRVSTRSR